MTHQAEFAHPTLLSRLMHSLRNDPILLGSFFGAISALSYTATNLTLRQMAGSRSLDWAIWVSCWKGLPAALVAWGLIWHRSRRGKSGLPPKSLVLPLIATGLFMQFVGNVSFQWGLSLGGLALTVPLTFATLIGSGAILGRIVLQESITPRSVGAIALLVISIVILSLGADQATQSTLGTKSTWVIVGAILAASFAGVAYGTCGVIIRRTTTGRHNVSLPGTLVLLSTTGVVALGMTSWVRMGTDRLLATTPTELGLMISAGCFNAIAFFACGAALMRLSVVRVNLINATQAAMCAAGGILLFQEALTIWVVLGTVLTVGGLMLMERPSTPAKSVPVVETHHHNSLDRGRVLTETFVASVEHHNELDSTNTRAMELGIEPVGQLPMLISADRQSAGRGRGNHAWWSNSGALTFSLLLDVKTYSLPADQIPRIALMTGLGISKAMETVFPKGLWKVKWPNDVMLGGRKICGILCEQPRQDASRLVIGVGININNSLVSAPEELRARATSLMDATNEPHDLSEILICVLQHLELTYAELATDSRRLVQEFRKRCWLTGRTITVENGSKTLQGYCQGIDETGALLLETPHGTERVLSGSITTDA